MKAAKVFGEQQKNRDQRSDREIQLGQEGR